MITLTELMGAMAVHVMHERDWTMEEAMRWVTVRIAEAREEYHELGAARRRRRGTGTTNSGAIARLPAA